MLKRLSNLNFCRYSILYSRAILNYQFKMFSLSNNENRFKGDQIYNGSEKAKTESNDYFYKNTADNKNLITIKEEQKAKMKSKLTLTEPTTKPLVENETYRELYRNFSLYIGEEESKELEDITHNEEKEGKLFKYGLPAKNELPFTQLMLKEEVDEKIPKTSTENLFELMGLDGNSSYEALILKIQTEYSHEADMYGSVVKAGETKHPVFEWGIPIPMSTLKEEKTMQKLRSYAMYNVDLPGNIQDVHPNKFIADLRPIEEFRHTPVVPIPEKDIREYKKKIEDKNRMGVYFEVKKQTLYYYGIAVLFVVILFQTFKYFYKESENMQTEIERIKFRRYRYREEDDVV